MKRTLTAIGIVALCAATSAAPPTKSQLEEQAAKVQAELDALRALIGQIEDPTPTPDPDPEPEPEPDPTPSPDPIPEDDPLPRLMHDVADFSRHPDAEVVSGVLRDTTKDICVCSGELTIAGTVKLTTLQTLPGSTLRFAPGAELIIRDVPLDLSLDPEQWGNGLLVHGNWIVDDVTREPYALTDVEISSGDALIELWAIPDGWKAGDRIVIPKTRQERLHRKLSWWRHEESEVRTISAIEGNRITLDSPLKYDHPTMPENPWDETRPIRVANLTQDTSIRSENPEGTRGHVAVTGNGNISLRGIGFYGLGRTTNGGLDNTTFDPETGKVNHIGTNQIAKYSIHWHHHKSGGTLDHFTVDDGLKWGVTIHGTDDVTCTNGVIHDCTGAGLATEDATEENIVIDNLTVVRVEGPPSGSNPLIKKWADFNGERLLQFGYDGSGLWFRGANVSVTNCCVYGARGYGYNFDSYYLPTQTSDPAFVPRLPLIKFDGNEAAGCANGMWVTWVFQEANLPHQVFENITFWNIADTGLFTYHEERHHYKNLLMVFDADVSGEAESHRSGVSSVPYGVEMNQQYVNTDFIFDNLRISGSIIGISMVDNGKGQGTTIRGELSNQVNLLYLQDARDAFELDIKHLPFSPQPVQSVTIPDEPVEVLDLRTSEE